MTLEVKAGQPTYKTATILSGTSLSGGVQVEGSVVGLIIPNLWTAAAITFRASMSGVTFHDLWDSATSATAAERTIASGNIPTTNGRFFALPLSDWLAPRFIMIRSGTSAAPVNQAQDSIITVIMAG